MIEIIFQSGFYFILASTIFCTIQKNKKLKLTSIKIPFSVFFYLTMIWSWLYRTQYNIAALTTFTNDFVVRPTAISEKSVRRSCESIGACCCHGLSAAQCVTSAFVIRHISRPAWIRSLMCSHQWTVKLWLHGSNAQDCSLSVSQSVSQSATVWFDTLSGHKYQWLPQCDTKNSMHSGYLPADNSLGCNTKITKN